MIKVACVLLQRAGFAFFLARTGRFLAFRLFRLFVLADAVGDEIQHIQARDLLLLEQIDRVGVLFTEHGNQHIERRDLLLPG